MASKGGFANDKLIENLETQLERLVTQLKDLEECRYMQSNIYSKNLNDDIFIEV